MIQHKNQFKGHNNKSLRLLFSPVTRFTEFILGLLAEPCSLLQRSCSCQCLACKAFSFSSVISVPFFRFSFCDSIIFHMFYLIHMLKNQRNLFNDDYKPTRSLSHYFLFRLNGRGASSNWLPAVDSSMEKVNSASGYLQSIFGSGNLAVTVIEVSLVVFPVKSGAVKRPKNILLA